MPKLGIFQQAMNYRVDLNTGILWIFRKGSYLPCVPESKVLSLLHIAYDEGGYWGKQGTLDKLRGLAYWPSQSMDVENYFCARHGSSQTFPVTRYGFNSALTIVL